MILVDSNVLIDAIAADPVWGSWSTAALIAAADRDEVAINPIIYAEISVGYATEAALDTTWRRPGCANYRCHSRRPSSLARLFSTIGVVVAPGHRRYRISTSARMPQSPA